MRRRHTAAQHTAARTPPGTRSPASGAPRAATGDAAPQRKTDPLARLDRTPLHPIRCAPGWKFVCFLTKVDTPAPADYGLHVVLHDGDNAMPTCSWLLRYPQFALRLVPASVAWVRSWSTTV